MLSVSPVKVYSSRLIFRLVTASAQCYHEKKPKTRTFEVYVPIKILLPYKLTKRNVRLPITPRKTVIPVKAGIHYASVSD